MKHYDNLQLNNDFQSLKGKINLSEMERQEMILDIEQKLAAPPKRQRVKQKNSYRYALSFVAIVAILTILVVPALFERFVTQPTPTTPGDDVTNETPTKTDLKTHLLLRSDQVFTSLADNDWQKLSGYVHPEKGVTFSFYAAIGNEPRNEVTLLREEIPNSADKQYNWGYDMGDRPHQMSLQQYVNDYLLTYNGGYYDLNYSEITYDASVVESGGIINSIKDTFPDAKYVEYFSPQLDENTYNWQALRFVWEEYEKEWYLIAIVRDVYSP